MNIKIVKINKKPFKPIPPAIYFPFKIKAISDKYLVITEGRKVLIYDSFPAKIISDIFNISKKWFEQYKSMEANMILVIDEEITEGFLIGRTLKNIFVIDMRTDIVYGVLCNNINIWNEFPDEATILIRELSTKENLFYFSPVHVSPSLSDKYWKIFERIK